MQKFQKLKPFPKVFNNKFAERSILTLTTIQFAYICVTKFERITNKKKNEKRLPTQCVGMGRM